MGRYDKVQDNDNKTSIALWKPQDYEEFKHVVFTNFVEAGSDSNPALDCEDTKGNKYTIYGAWERNVNKMVRQFGTFVDNWDSGVLNLDKKSRINLVPVQIRVAELHVG